VAEEDRSGRGGRRKKEQNENFSHIRGEKLLCRF